MPVRAGRYLHLNRHRHHPLSVRLAQKHHLRQRDHQRPTIWLDAEYLPHQHQHQHQHRLRRGVRVAPRPHHDRVRDPHEDVMIQTGFGRGCSTGNKSTYPGALNELEVKNGNTCQSVSNLAVNTTWNFLPSSFSPAPYLRELRV